MGVDWEQRVDFERLRRYRLGRAKAALSESELGALLLFDPNNLRYVTSTAIGTWERDKNIRFALLFREDDPILWDFGSAARHHQLYCPWFAESSWRAWVPPMRGAMPDQTGTFMLDDLAWFCRRHQHKWTSGPAIDKRARPFSHSVKRPMRRRRRALWPGRWTGCR